MAFLSEQTFSRAVWQCRGGLTSVCAAAIVVIVLVIVCAPLAEATIIFNRWNVTDGSIFSASASAVVRYADGSLYRQGTLYMGMRNPVAADGERPDAFGSTSAFRLGVASEWLLALAVGHLETQGLLPFSRASPIPLSYLPTALQTLLTTTVPGSNYLFNPNYGSGASFITLNMLLQHTSSLTENGFIEYGTTQGPLNTSETPAVTLPTREAFLNSLFAGVGAASFSATCQPSSAANVWAQGGCVNYSRINIALAGHVVDTVISAQPQGPMNLETYVYTNILTPMQLTGTFFLDKTGHMPLPTYPPNLSTSVADALFKTTAVSDVNYSWGSVVPTFTIAADPFSDYMVYTTTSDLQSIVASTIVPGSPFYDSFGVSQFLSNAVQLTRDGSAITSSAMVTILREASANGAVSRGVCLNVIDLRALCDELGRQLVEGCNVSRWNVSSTTSAYAFASTTEFNQVAVLCTKNSDNNADVCVAAEVAYTDSTAFMPIRYAQNSAMALALSQLQPYVLNSYSRDRGHRKTSMTGLWIFIGVLAAIVVTVVLSYVTDYFVQPLPPAKAVAPVPGTRGMAAENSWGLGGGAAASTTGVANALSPLPAVNLFADTEEDGITPLRPSTSVGHPTIGSSTSGTRSRRRTHAMEMGTDGSGSSLASTGPRHRHRDVTRSGGGADASTSGSSSSPRGVARFDAYI